MKKIFFKSNKKDDIIKIIKKHKLVAIDSHITIESDMCDDYIQIINDTVILAVPFNHNACSNALFENFKELKFEASGNLKNATDRLKYSRPFDNYMVFHFDINSQKRVYAFEYEIDEKNLLEIGNPVKQDIIANMLLHSKKMNNISLKKEIDNMENKTFFNEESYRTEKDIDKIVRFCNRTINNRVRSKFNINQNTAGYFKIGATSPKRNTLHQIALLNNIEILKIYFKNNCFDENENEAIKKNERLNLINQNNKHVIFLVYNWHKDEIYIKIDGVHYSVSVLECEFYDFLEKGAIGKSKVNCDTGSIVFHFDNVKIIFSNINKKGYLITK